MIFFVSGELEVFRPQGFLLELVACFFDLPPDDLLNILNVKDFRSFSGARVLRVLVTTPEIRFGALPTALSASGFRGERW